MSNLLRDLRYALRMLGKSPGFALVATFSLALGIGANAAIFSVVYAVLLKPLPYVEPDRLVSIAGFVPEMRATIPTMALRAADFDAYRRSGSAFSGMAALRPQDFNLTGSGEPVRLYGARVSANFFSLLGVPPEHGRGFLPEEDVPGRDHVVVISHDLWEGRFGADPGVLNRVVSLDGESYTVVGILPKGFLFPTGKQLHPMLTFGPRVDVWKPIAFSTGELQHRGNWAYGCLARLKPDVTPDQARENLDAIAATLPFPDGKTVRTQVVPLHEVFSGPVRRGLLLLLGAVAVLLLIACVNLANLLLARTSARSVELATRMALGASRYRLARQLLTESVTLAGLGAAMGLLVGYWGNRLLVSLGPADTPAARSSELCGPVLLFTVVVAVATGVAFGLAPAVAAAGGDLRERLSSRGATFGHRAGRVGRTLVVVEVALCTALSVGAGLLLHSFAKVMRVDRGFTAERILTAELSLPHERYPSERTVAFCRELADRVGSLPGVVSAGIATAAPLGGKGGRGENGPVYFEADNDPAVTSERPFADFPSVTEGYFTALDIPLRAGRLLEDRESTPATVISAGLARRLWPGRPLEAAIGRRIKLNHPAAEPVVVVGIVGDVRSRTLEGEPSPTAYRPVSQAPFGDVTLVVRAAEAPETLAQAIRSAVWEIDRSLPVTAMRTMAETVSESTAERRFQAMLVLLFAGLSLVLAALGIYGVTSYSVSRRSREISLHMALGAQRGEVLFSVLAQGLRPVVIGLLIGLAAAALGGSSIRTLLFGIEPLDPLSLAAVSLVLLSTALLACYVPARRAASIEPMAVLRCE